MALQIRRGTNAERLTITPAEGELVYTTDSKKLFVGDGSTVGGNASATGIVSVLADTSPQLGGTLDLNGQNINGTGNIDINGTITATGNINLGDGAEDNIIIGGQIGSHLTPTTTESFDLGSAAITWRELHTKRIFAQDIVARDVTGRQGTFEGLEVDGIIAAESFAGSIIANDSTVLVDAVTGRLSGQFEGNVTGNVVGDVVGDLTGSVFADDSTLLVDAVNGLLTGNLTGNVTGNVTGDLTGDVTGNVTGSHFGYQIGDMTGSVFADDSSVIVDSVNQALTAIDITGTHMFSATYEGQTATFEDRTADNQGTITLRRKVSGTISDNKPYGLIYFSKNDDEGALVPTLIQGGKNSFRIVNDPAGVGSSNNELFNLSWYYNKLGVGYRNPTGDERLQVNGSAAIDGYLDVEQVRISGNSISTNVSNANLQLSANGTGTIELDIPTQATVGAAGAAAAVPATPSTYLKINVGGTDYVVPAFAVS